MAISCAVPYASTARIVARRATGVILWKLLDGGEFERVLDMDLNVATHLVCVGVSDDGKWLACSDATEVKLFRLVRLLLAFAQNQGES